MQGKAIVFALGAMLLLVAAANAQDGRAREDMRRWRGPGPGPRPEWRSESVAEAGYVFMDGQLIAAPYVVRQHGQQLTINDRKIINDPDKSMSAQDLAQSLQNNASAVCFEGHPLVLVHDGRMLECLRVLSNPDLASRNVQAVLDYNLPPHADVEQWRKWLSTYLLPETQRAAAVALVTEADAARAEGEQVIAANQRLSTWAYPLTIFGMLMSVVSFGHLLQFPPRGNSDLIPSRRRAELCRATVIFLVMVVILSSLDLVWTLLTSQAGQMNELNPIGKELLNDPWLLSLFKVIATFFSCSLLLMLRRHPRAQLASWWMCLVCTLLTFRWLVLNSMFVA